jgi:uncharacterized protein (UPF0210 family)
MRRKMINIYEVTETNKMVEKENLDVRTITLGINLLDCASENLDEVNEKIYKKITTLAKDRRGYFKGNRYSNS